MEEKKKGFIKKFVNEFKAFALKGNVMDLAVGVIIGAAFQGIVTSFTENFINPIIGCIGGADVEGKIHLLGNQYINYGAFLTAVINFIIMAFVIFVIMKVINKLASLGKHEEPEKPAEPPVDIVLLTEIRDLLKAQQAAEASKEEQKAEEGSYQVDIWKYSYEILEAKILKELPFEPQEHASGIQFDGNRIVNDYSIVSVTMTIEDNNDISPNKIETLNSHQLHVDKMQNTKTHKYELYMSSIGEEPDPMDDFHYQMKYGEKSEPVTLYYLVSDDDLTEDANINLLLNPMGAYGSKTTYKLKDENTTVESVKKYAFIKLNDLLRKSEEY